MGMESYASRASSSASLLAIVLACVAVLNALSVGLFPQKPTGSITLGTVFDFSVHPYLKVSMHPYCI